jgi:hypothetical protein
MRWGPPLERRTGWPIHIRASTEQRAKSSLRTKIALELLIKAIPASRLRTREREIQSNRIPRANPVQIKEADMSDEFAAAASASQSESANEKSVADRAAETIRSASHRVSDAIDAGREPDMPLDILTKLVREAPLPSLAIAFLFGVLVARRR